MSAPQPRTQSEAECYQRLRSHLAFLKLEAAAEALSAVLDEARRAKLPVIGALERLLAVEVSATETRRLTSRLRFACLPACAVVAGRLRLRRPTRRRGGADPGSWPPCGSSTTARTCC